MKQLTMFVAAALVLAIAAPAFAGHGEKCSNDVQACLNHWAAKKAGAWLGLKYDKTGTDAFVVKEIVPGSPAAAAGFQVGDVVTALNGVSLSDHEALKKAKGEWKPGQQVSYTVKRGATEKQIAATLAPMPDEVYASMLGEHMLANHAAGGMAHGAEAAPAAQTAPAASPK